MIDLKRLTKTAIPAAFFLILALPIFQMCTHVFVIAPLDENRVRVAPPGRPKLLDANLFLEQSRKWFDDNYGFRDDLIRTKTQLDFSLFHVSDRIYIGAGNWLFYKANIDQEETHMESLTDSQLTTATRKLEQLRDYLAARGIKLIVVTNQEKQKFYPQHLPYDATKARKFHRFDDFRARIHAIQGITYIDTTNELLAISRRRLTFYRTDSHWNDPAGFEIARILVDHIAGEEHRGANFWRHPLFIQTHHYVGRQATFMPLFHPPGEEALFVFRPWISSSSYDKIPPPPFEWSSRTPKAENLLPPTVLFGDSFADGMIRSGLADYFQEFYRAQRRNATIPDTLSKLPPGTRYFILQFVDVFLLSLVNIQIN